MTDIRWQQRFRNFSRAFILLRSALETRPLEHFSDLEQEGIIQRFAYSYELAWKTMKDYLEENGVVITPVTPRNVIKEAFAAGIIENGQVWINMMLHRNLLAHTYDFSKFKEVLRAVDKEYLAALDALHDWFITRQMET
ncbi:nucleotidyltransferase substrate binding protein [Desulfobulbus alkaliphilus]|uniref:nucleotidyltransferase substrate binding protein n=1 Tax=Desulfobulbus alkaliphilus TaxID=869814 RepID=UPI0019622B9D|nr:nucleotidyltransferase substrate binding protein [Desulfobulbus alkaliphilus]MBM9538204.1 nucleotidyltransferase substrate binding protein [Desulfobulbus alkaliphilus]